MHKCHVGMCNYQLTTMAHIGHQYISFRIYSCNSDFHRKTPTCVHFKKCNSEFHHKYPSCHILKCTTRIFAVKIPVVNIVEFATHIFTAKLRVINIVENATRISQSTHKNPSCDIQERSRGLPLLLTIMAEKTVQKAIFECPLSSQWTQNL